MRLFVDRYRPHIHWLWAALAYIALTVAITDPVARQLATHLAGQENGDVLEFIWSIWWWQRALLILHQSPVNITTLSYPAGQTFALLPLMSQSFLLAIPFSVLTTPVVAYNIVWLASFVLCGLAGYALCRDLSGENLAGFIGGVIWVVFPNKMGHALAGHLFFQLIFAFALYTLALIRVLHKPTLIHAMFAGLALTLAGTVHPVYIAYFLAPVTFTLFLAAWWRTKPHRTFFNKSNIIAFSLMFGVAAFIIVPFLAPALIQMASGQLKYLTERGATGFAFDGISYFIPAPGNPFIQDTPLARLAQRIVISEFESIGYVGWSAIILAGIGVWARRTESKVWIVLGLFGTVLALGPLLKLGGPLVQVPVEDGSDRYPLLLPYAFIGNLPLFQWSRTPGRISILIMLALSVLATYGWTALRRPNWGRATQLVVLVGITLLLTAETLVKFPFPTIPATVPTPLLTLRAVPSGQAVITLPWNDNDANLRALYWQTIHQHPMVGGRVYRDLPTGYPEHDFISHLLLAGDEQDIVLPPTNTQRREVLSALRVNWVLVDARADVEQSAFTHLSTWLGPPKSADAEVALFNIVPQPLASDDTVLVVGGGWDVPQDWGNFTGRWLRGRGTIFVYSTSSSVGKLVFSAVPGQTPHSMGVLVNGQLAGYFLVGDWLDYQTDPIILQPGLNQIAFVDDNPLDKYVGDPRCAEGSPVSGPYPAQIPCDLADRSARELGIVIGAVRFVPLDEALPLVISGVQFGDVLELTGYLAPTSVKPGTVLPIHLLWRAHENLPADYTLFVHLVNAKGELVTQFDAQPFGDMYPTSRWVENQVVAHNVTLSIPANTLSGEYTVRLGWYTWPALERLFITGANTTDNILNLARVNVEP